MASYYDVLFDKHRRAEHWDNAVSQGQHCARALLGERTPFIHVPYFFSDVFDLSYEFWGDPSGAEEIVERGDMSSSSFSVWWLRQGKLAAAFLMNRPEEEREAAPRLIQSKEADFRKDAARSAADTFAQSRTEDKDGSRSVSRSTVSAKALSPEGTPRLRLCLGVVVLRPGRQTAEPRLEKVRRRSRGLQSLRIEPDLLRGAGSSLRIHRGEASELRQEQFYFPHLRLPSLQPT